MSVKETKSSRNFPAARIKKLLKELAQYEGKLTNKPAVRFQKDAISFVDKFLADQIKVAFDDAIRLTRLAKRSTMYEIDFATATSLKEPSNRSIE